jgi:hypothetical protein
MNKNTVRLAPDNIPRHALGNRAESIAGLWINARIAGHREFLFVPFAHHFNSTFPCLDATNTRFPRTYSACSPSLSQT